MKNIFPFLALFLSSCITVSHVAQTSGIDESKLKEIPENSSEVILEKDVTPQELFNEVYASLLLRGHRISKDDKERLYITTEGKDVGQSTLQRSTIVVSEIDNGAKAVIKSEWKPGTSAALGGSMFAGVALSLEWEQATWVNGRPGIAFAEAFAIADGVGGKVIFK